MNIVPYKSKECQEFETKNLYFGQIFIPQGFQTFWMIQKLSLALVAIVKNNENIVPRIFAAEACESL